MAYVCALCQLSNCFTALDQSCSNQYFNITNRLTNYSDNPTENNHPALQFPSALQSILASFSLLFCFFQLLPLINSLVSSKCKGLPFRTLKLGVMSAVILGFFWNKKWPYLDEKLEQGIWLVKTCQSQGRRTLFCCLYSKWDHLTLKQEVFSVCLLFTYLENCPFDLLHSLQVWCWGPMEVQCQIWRNLEKRHIQLKHSSEQQLWP